MATFVLIVTLSTLVVGILVLWANPSRFTNQLCAWMSLIATARSFFIYLAILASGSANEDHSVYQVAMLRVSGAVSMFIPWVLWLVIDSYSTKDKQRKGAIRRSIPWFVVCVVLALIAISDVYYKNAGDNVLAEHRHGPMYAYVNIILVVWFVVLAVRSWLWSRKQSGIRSLEMQFFVLNYSVVGGLTVALAILSHYLEVPLLRQCSHALILGGVALLAWAISFYHIYDVRQVMVSMLQRASTVVFLVGGMYVLWWAFGGLVEVRVALLISVAVCCTGALWIDRRSREWFGLGEERRIAKMRSAAIGLARTEPHPEKLATLFEGILCADCHTSSGALLVDHGETHVGRGFELAKSRVGYAALAELGWATPESLIRRRTTLGREDLHAFMAANSLGLIVAAPRGSPAPALIIALGTKSNEWPFTYPEVQRIQNVAELMDNILTRSRFALQAAVQAKLEHLSIMSRGLAHDLNNMITPVSSFLVSTDECFPPGSTEREVQAAARKSVGVMQEYVKEALFFSDKLELRLGPVDLPKVLPEVVALCRTRATSRGVLLKTADGFHDPVTADGILVQRMLVNLVNNAIDASPGGKAVTLASAPGPGGGVRLTVSDEGTGIPAENLQRVFDPYFTTKNHGDEQRGFGLGLTICQKIAQLHGGTISLQSRPGVGTTVVVDLPNTQILQQPA